MNLSKNERINSLLSVIQYLCSAVVIYLFLTIDLGLYLVKPKNCLIIVVLATLILWIERIKAATFSRPKITFFNIFGLLALGMVVLLEGLLYLTGRFW